MCILFRGSRKKESEESTGIPVHEFNTIKVDMYLLNAA